MQLFLILVSTTALALAAPQSRLSVEELLKQNNQEMNTIDVDGTNEKEVEYALTHLVPPAAAADVLVVGVDDSTPVKMADTLVAPTEASLGSQFAIGDLFPERVGVVTGHRIPIGLFPLQTQERVLNHKDIEVPSQVLMPPSKVATPADHPAHNYVNTSSFRRHNKPTTAPTTTTTTATESSTRSLSQIRAFAEIDSIFADPTEGDSTYLRSLDSFAPPSFF